MADIRPGNMSGEGLPSRKITELIAASASAAGHGNRVYEPNTAPRRNSGTACHNRHTGSQPPEGAAKRTKVETGNIATKVVETNPRTKLTI